MVSQWHSMAAFLAQQQQQQRREAPSSNIANDTNSIDAARAQFEAGRQDNLTTQQRIAAELVGCDIILSGYFTTENGYHIVKDVKMTKPLLTQAGDVVPESHVRLSHVRIIGHAVPRALHFYAHPYGNLGMLDLVRYLNGAAQGLGLREGEGVFEIASLGAQISFVQIGGIPSGHPGAGS
jgi:hypothetical protein